MRHRLGVQALCFLGAATFAFGAIGLVGSDMAFAQPAKGKNRRAPVQIDSGRELGPALWSSVAKCDGIKDDFEKRQCVAILAERKRHILATTYLLDARPSLSVTDFDPKSKSVSLTLSGCIVCDEPVEIDGAKKFLIADTGKPKVEGGAVVVPPLKTLKIPFKNAAVERHWRRHSWPRMRVDFLVKVLGTIASWKAGSASGYRLNVVGYRVYDPCDGKIMMSSVQTADQKPDKTQCGPAYKEKVKKPKVVKPKKPKAPPLPRKLSPAAIARALAPVRKTAQQCFDTYGVEGESNLRITFDNNGDVVDIAHKGDFEDTPTGECIEEAVRAVKFGKSKSPKTTVKYPIVLR